MVVKDMSKQEKYEIFKTKAEAFGATVHKASNQEEALKVITELMFEKGYKNAVSTDLTKVDLSQLSKSLQEKNIKVETGRLKRAVIEASEVGITEFDFGIIDLGTIAQNATDPYVRLMSMLPPYHIALINSDTLVEDFATALNNIYKNNGSLMPGYVSFVSGPSRTADIERVLTIGVHGPERLHIICID